MIAPFFLPPLEQQAQKGHEGSTRESLHIASSCIPNAYISMFTQMKVGQYSIFDMGTCDNVKNHERPSFFGDPTLPKSNTSTQESNFKNITFFVLGIVVVAGFLGDKYYEHLARQRRKQRKQGTCDTPDCAKERSDRHAILTAVRRVVKKNWPHDRA